MGHDDLKVKGDLHVEDKLKVDHDAHFKDDVQVDDRLTVSGRVNLGDVAVTQITSETTAVTVNSASGVITLYAAFFATLDEATPTTFTVNNSKVLASSVVLASLNLGAPVPSVLTGANCSVVVGSVANGSFTLTVTNNSGANLAGAALKVNFLVC
jgi:hypothetical protein